MCGSTARGSSLRCGQTFTGVERKAQWETFWNRITRVFPSYRIVGPPCVLSCRLRNKPLPPSVRPTYSCTMEGTVICFTGFKDKEMLVSISLPRQCMDTSISTIQHGVCSKAHLMGASIRKDMTSSVTHVVAHSVSGSKYKARLCSF